MAVKIGFIGTGGIARRHFAALKDIPEARVVACTDVDPDRAAEAAARFAGAGAYTDHREMLDKQDLDAAYICVPPHAHGPIELDLIERRIPFFLEKPLANDLETAAEILEALQRTDLVTSVGYHLRYGENVGRLRDLLDENPPVVARGLYACGIPGAPWWRRKEQSGGQVVEQSTHVYDLARCLFGEVDQVFCQCRRDVITDEEDYNVEDASICSLRFRDGLLCEITSTCAVSQGEISLEVLTRKARARLEGGVRELTVTTEQVTRSYRPSEDLGMRENLAFVGALTQGDTSEIKSTYEDSYRTHAVTCAANRSMETGEPEAP